MDACMKTFAILIKFMTSGVAWNKVTDCEWHKRVWACIHDKGGHFEHLTQFKSTHMLMFRSNSIILC